MHYIQPMIPLGVPVNAVIKSIGSGRCMLLVEGREVPMNIWELPPKSKPGGELEVTVYNDAKESLKATVLNCALTEENSSRLSSIFCPMP